MPAISVAQQALIKERFLISLRHHLAGLLAKVENDFSKANFEKELASLQNDPVYSKFAFNSPEYVLVRLVGRVSISVGRRLGEIYDKIPRYVAAARFGLRPEQVAPLLQKLELDIALRFGLLSRHDVKGIQNVVRQYLNVDCGDNGLGVEIRYNFNPNDSARLRKDVVMAGLVQAENLLPIYLIYSAISPRDEAIARLKRAGWTFLVGERAIGFSRELFGLDLESILDEPAIAAEVKREIGAIMTAMVGSHAFQHVVSRHGR